MKQISFVVVTCNRPNQLREAVLSIRNSELENGVMSEIVVVDIGEKSWEEGEFPIDRYIRFPATKSLSKARNVGVLECTADHVAFLDDDAVIDRKYLRAFSLQIKSDKSGERVICGQILSSVNREQAFSRYHGRQYRNISRWSIDTVLSSAMIVPRSVLREIGGFDEDFGVGARWGGSEETDLVLRCLAIGIHVAYVPELVVYHPDTNETFAAMLSLRNKYVRYGMGRGALVAKHDDLSSALRVKLLVLASAGGIIQGLVTARPGQVLKHAALLKGKAVGYVAFCAQRGKR